MAKLNFFLTALLLTALQVHSAEEVKSVEESVSEASKAAPELKIKKGSVIWIDKKETVTASDMVDGVIWIDKKVDITATVEEPGQEKGVMYVAPHKKFVVDNTTTAKDCEAMKVNGYYEEEYKACLKATESKAKFNCEEVTEQFAVCNGVRYVVDLKNNDSLKRDVKKIENYIAPEKLKPGSKASSK